jgi:hypothetical protein
MYQVCGGSSGLLIQDSEVNLSAGELPAYKLAVLGPPPEILR